MITALHAAAAYHGVGATGSALVSGHHVEHAALEREAAAWMGYPRALLFGSGYPMVRPGRLFRELAGYRFPAEVAARYPRFDGAAALGVLGGNATRLYRIPLPAALPSPAAAVG